VNIEYLCIAIVAAMWGSYPLISRSTHVGGAMGALILMLGGLIPVSIATAWSGGLTRPSSADLMKLALAGVMMGTGTVAFNQLAISRRLDASISIPIVDTAMLLVSVVGAVLFFAEPVTARKLAGVGLLIAGIVALKPQ
jgi:drug/metabolite transporter (DMT)-like permease